MDLQKINTLLEKYLEGQTNVSEEKALKAFFQKEDIPADLAPYKVLFNYLSHEASTKAVHQENWSPWEDQKTSDEKDTSKWWASKWSHVAVVTILFSVSLFSARNYYQKKQAEIAYQQTLEAFSLLAHNYQKATAPAVYLNEFEQAKAKIYKPKKK